MATNRAIEQAAIDWVTDLEQRAGRTPQDTRRTGPVDISSPPRAIEVKAYGTSARGKDLWLEPRQVQEARANAHFWLYVVENIAQGDPALFTLRMFDQDQVLRLLERAREHHYWTAPWPVADYDAHPPTTP